jgi:hypothetical protein
MRDPRLKSWGREATATATTTAMATINASIELTFFVTGVFGRCFVCDEELLYGWKTITHG